MGSAAWTCGLDGHRAFPPAAAACGRLLPLLLKLLLRPSLREAEKNSQKNLLLDHLADPSGVRPPPLDNAYYQSLEITSAPASSPSALQDLLASLSHHLLAMSLKPPSLIN